MNEDLLTITVSPQPKISYPKAWITGAGHVYFKQMALQTHQSKEQAAGADTWQSLGLDTVL